MVIHVLLTVSRRTCAVVYHLFTPSSSINLTARACHRYIFYEFQHEFVEVAHHYVLSPFSFVMKKAPLLCFIKNTCFENFARAVGAIIQSVYNQGTTVIFEFFRDRACAYSTQFWSQLDRERA